MPNVVYLALIVSEIWETKKRDRRVWLYRFACWCWSRLSILYGVRLASFCLLHTFAQT